jgi:hypothetical protein
MHHYRPDFQRISVQNSTIIVFSFGSSSGHGIVKEVGGGHISEKKRIFFGDSIEDNQYGGLNCVMKSRI